MRSTESRLARRSPLTDPRVRAWVFQVLAVVTVVAFGWFLFVNTQANLAHRGITSGFGFLDNAAGFGISQHLIDYSESDSYGRVFWVGLLNTLLVSVIGIILATLIGFALGVARLSSNWLIISNIVDFIRCKACAYTVCTLIPAIICLWSAVD